MFSDGFCLSQLDMHPLDVPFRVAFKHASAERSRTSAVIAVTQTASGLFGYGEGCPRTYVSGEDVQSCLAFYQAHAHELLAIQSLADVRHFAQVHHAQIDQHPAAWCALECALLDVLGQHHGVTVEELLGLPALTGNFAYSAVLGVSQDAVFQAKLAQYVRLGVRDFKMKISGDLQADQAHINAIVQSAPNAKIRLDANNFWSDWGAAFSYLQALRGFFWAVEEPLQTQDFTGMEELAQRLDCRIILDESCLTCADLERPSRNPSLWVVNVRVSKMGGVLRSIEVVQACTQAAIPVIVGAQVGETSLLTRAALTVVHANKAAVVAQEGAFGVRLLEHDIAQPCLMFGEKGNLQPAGLSPRGWGLSVQMPGGAENVPIIGA